MRQFKQRVVFAKTASGEDVHLTVETVKDLKTAFESTTTNSADLSGILTRLDALEARAKDLEQRVSDLEGGYQI